LRDDSRLFLNAPCRTRFRDLWQLCWPVAAPDRSAPSRHPTHRTSAKTSVFFISVPFLCVLRASVVYCFK